VQKRQGCESGELNLHLSCYSGGKSLLSVAACLPFCILPARYELLRLLKPPLQNGRKVIIYLHSQVSLESADFGLFGRQTGDGEDREGGHGRCWRMRCLHRAEIESGGSQGSLWPLSCKHCSRGDVPNGRAIETHAQWLSDLVA
jgi:hypothetical protein